MAKLQKTIINEASFSGIGVHTGNMTKITFKPAPADTGIKFIRTDVAEAPEIPALIDYVVETARGTTLGRDVDGQMVKVHTVEHVLAAVASLEIDNLRVEMDNNEPPIGDGSSRPFLGYPEKSRNGGAGRPAKIFRTAQGDIHHRRRCAVGGQSRQGITDKLHHRF